MCLAATVRPSSRSGVPTTVKNEHAFIFVNMDHVFRW